MHAADVIFDVLTHSGRVLLTGPTAPDGDSIGACLALQRVLRERGVDAVVAGSPPLRYRWLVGADQMVPDDAVADDFTAVVVLDGDRHRLSRPITDRFERAPVRGIIDHHASTRPDGYTHVWLDPRSESACGMLLRAFRRWGVPIDAALADLLYTGIVFDTGGFRHSNTLPETHVLAAELVATGIDHAAIAIRTLFERTPAGLRAMGQILADADQVLEGRLCIGRAPITLQRELALVEGDLEGVVDALVNTVGTEVAALLIERDDGTVKYSLRSRGDLDVAKVAQQLHPTGGGHPRASGASIRGSIAVAEQALLDVLGPALGPPGAPSR
jgi:bifunctional oligoribonuclease and PAP phosphatase NrnA